MTSIKERLCTPYGKGKRPMHRSTLTLGDQTKCVYTTTHAESFSGKGCEGEALAVLSRDSGYSSQHSGKLDLKNIPETKGQTHSRDVYGPKEIIPHHVLHKAGLQNRTQDRHGSVMKEVTNPTEATLYQSTYQKTHCTTTTTTTTERDLPNEAVSGQPVSWHSHDIITGEKKATAGPERLRRQSGESALIGARRWETHHDSLRLY